MDKLNNNKRQNITKKEKVKNKKPYEMTVNAGYAHKKNPTKK